MDDQSRQRSVIRSGARGLAGLLAALLLLPGVAAAASVGSFGAFPAARHGARPTPYFKLRLAPRHTTTVTAVAVNSSSRPVTLGVAPVAGLTGQTSGAVYGNTARIRSSSLTVRPVRSSVTLPPHARRAIRVRVHVTRHAVAGDHLAGIAFADRGQRRAHGQFAVVEVFRVVVGISVRVPGHAVHAVALGRVTPEALGGTSDAALGVSVANTGGLYCKPDLSLRLAGRGRVVTETRSLDTILPGQSIDYPMSWSHPLSRGGYVATVHATGCGAARRRVQAVAVHVSRRAAIPGAPTIVHVPVRAAAARSSVPWPVIALVGAGGVLIGVFASRRRRRTPPGPPGTPAPVLEG